VLEVGCGKAAFAGHIPKSAEYAGLEFSTQAKEMALLRGIEIKNMSIEDFAIKINENRDMESAGFDVVCSFQVLEHVANPNQFLSAKIACLNADSRAWGII